LLFPSMKSFTYILVLAVLVGFASCDHRQVFDQYREIGNSVWHKDSIITFTVPVTDTLENHNLLIQIRNETSYRFSNLWLFIRITEPDGTVDKDTFEVVLADPSGRWLGDGFGGLKTRQAIYRRNVTFPSSGNFVISIGHGMRDELLKGIHDVGLRVEKANP
jgi:gliding motility-associated lipoprotein GldH